MKLISEKDVTVDGREGVIFEYEGEFPGHGALRFVALALLDGSTNYTLTGTARKDRFPAVEKDFRATIESFRLPQPILKK
jgi:hypothetical protein